MKALVIAIALLVGSNAKEDAKSTNELNQLYAELIAEYGWNETAELSAIETPQAVEIYTQAGTLLLKSEDIDQDLYLLEAELVAAYRQADFVMEAGETKIYILN